MLCADRRNIDLSFDLRKLVQKNFGEAKQGVVGPRANRKSNPRTVSKQLEDLRKRLDLLPLQDEHYWQECSSMLESRQNAALASIILERLQSHSANPLHIPVRVEQGFGYHSGRNTLYG